MDMQTNNLEFYKVRTVGERFAVAGDFVRQNWKLLLRNIVYIGAPLAIVSGYFSQEYVTGALDNVASGDYEASFVVNALLCTFLMVCLQLFLFSMTGAILYQYTQNKLREDSSWKDLRGDMFFIMGKLFVLGLILTLMIAVILLVVVVLFYILGFNSAFIASLSMLSLLGICIALIPSLMMAQQPIIFERESAWRSLVKGMRLGFKNWGAVFLTLLLGGVLLMIFSYFLAMPYYVYLMVHIEGGGGFLGYVLAAMASLGTVIAYPLYIIFVGLQYTSIVEKEEGISLQNKIDDFDQL
ncbi:hypothetical protein LJB92_01245 [Bacteroidales bacterium OttesenSCG-928-M06]|nr:hypothetical protein [Bacteroidales bacterium OttesenSCG-928-M06]